jgi:hypothetical protein
VRPADRAFVPVIGGKDPAPEADVEKYLERETRFDPDVWIVESEDRNGTPRLDNIVAI